MQSRQTQGSKVQDVANFQSLIFRHMDRISMLVSEPSDKDPSTRGFLDSAIRRSVEYMEALLDPYLDDEYRRDVGELSKGSFDAAREKAAALNRLLARKRFLPEEDAEFEESGEVEQ